MLVLGKGAAAILLAPIVIPLAFIVSRLKRRIVGLPSSIPTAQEMRALERKVSEGNAAATRLWFRGAFYRQLTQVNGLTGAQAEETAIELADCANEPDGFGVQVRLVRGG